MSNANGGFVSVLLTHLLVILLILILLLLNKNNEWRIVKN